LFKDIEENRRLQGKNIDIWQYPDGTIELRANGTSLPFITYDRLGELDQGAIVDKMRLRGALEMIKLVQDTPSRPCHHWTARPHAERTARKKITMKPESG
jgi:hypothetical protein